MTALCSPRGFGVPSDDAQTTWLGAWTQISKVVRAVYPDPPPFTQGLGWRFNLGFGPGPDQCHLQGTANVGRKHRVRHACRAWDRIVSGMRAHSSRNRERFGLVSVACSMHRICGVAVGLFACVEGLLLPVSWDSRWAGTPPQRIGRQSQNPRSAFERVEEPDRTQIRDATKMSRISVPRPRVYSSTVEPQTARPERG